VKRYEKATTDQTASVEDNTSGSMLYACETLVADERIWKIIEHASIGQQEDDYASRMVSEGS